MILADTTPGSPVVDMDGLAIDWEAVHWRPTWWDRLWGAALFALVAALNPEGARMDACL